MDLTNYVIQEYVDKNKLLSPTGTRTLWVVEDANTPNKFYHVGDTEEEAKKALRKLLQKQGFELHKLIRTSRACRA